MRNIKWLFALLTMSAWPTAIIAADPQPNKDAVAEELKKLAGTWEVESHAIAGRESPKNNPPVRYEIKGALAKVASTDASWILELDPSKDPKRMTQIEAELKDGKPVPTAGGKVNIAVYSLDKDKLTIVIAGPQKEGGKKLDFPKSVTPKKGDSVRVIVMKRVSQ